ncbi:MAG TPA: hypothetical protein DCZ43_01345, partial [candidate division Zixibacteria bacterium]|nr:hypothetical protein [candidate division Zixibacteria bacterium]
TLTLILALTIPVLAQDQTLLGNDISHGGFGGPVAKFTNIDNQFGVLVGGRGGWIINHSLILGGGGYGLVQDNINRRYLGPDEKQYLTMGYFGAMLEYDIHPSRLVHTSIIMLIGGGELNQATRHHDSIDINGATKDNFFVCEPEINVTLNLVNFMRLGIGGSYRFVSGVESFGLTNSDIAGPAASLTLRFGNF